MTTRVLYEVNSPIEDWLEVARTMQTTHGWEPCYWLTTPASDVPIAEAFPAAVRHSYLRAIRGLPPEGVEPIPARPLDEPTLERFRTCESRVLAMMDRSDVDGSYTYPERIRQYHRLLSYWLGVIDSVRPDVAVFAITPHEVADYVAYEACHKSGIQTLIYSDASIPLAITMRTDADAETPGLRERYSTMIDRPTPKDGGGPADLMHALESVAGIPKSTVEHVRSLLGGYDGAQPDYMRKQLAPGSRIPAPIRRAMNAMKVWRWGLYVRNLTREWITDRRPYGLDAFKKAGIPMELSWMTGAEIKRLRRQGIKKKTVLRKAYERRVSHVDLSEAYVYVPLQYQPERSTSPEGGDYTHQLLMVGLLHDLLPDGWYLYVREHPTQFVACGWGEQGRSEVFYRDLVQFPRVRLVGHDVSPFALIDSARAVATVTGTTGWESIIRGRPVLAFGNVWYRPCDGVLPTKSRDDLRGAYRRLLEGFRVDPGRVAVFIQAFHSLARSADTDQGGQGRSAALTHEENVDGLLGLLLGALSGTDAGSMSERVPDPQDRGGNTR